MRNTLNDLRKEQPSSLREKKLRPETEQLTELKRQLRRKESNEEDIKKLQKEIKKPYKRYTKNYNTRQRKISAETKHIIKLKSETGEDMTKRNQLLNTVRDFNRKLYTTEIPEPNLDADRPTIANVESEETPEINTCEIIHALQKIKNRRAQGEEGVIKKMILHGG